MLLAIKPIYQLKRFETYGGHFLLCFPEEGAQNPALGKPNALISTLKYDDEGVTFPGNSSAAVNGNVTRRLHT